ncbi:prephenate dehydrogenase/arogenate dehydrogenase family protein [Candidatus Woesearchaeota archaeon]|nr:prephenate dehydrogenase/arogenate dehydrogenase family protein [Candidatus Woesearchaeota archaeon]
MSRLGIIGVGLLGSSVARAARFYGVADTIAGFDRDSDNLTRAEELGVVDIACATLAEAVEGADRVVLAIPVGGVAGVLTALAPHWNPATRYTDTGSTKQDVIAVLRAVFGEVPSNFVPGHPIAGAEQSGVAAGRADLFVGKRVILTPCPETSAVALADITAFWQQLGATVACMDAHRHDRILAATSHLPHVLAFVLTELLGRRDEQEAIFQYAAGGFRDFSRIASSDPVMWRDICVANQAHLVPLIDEYCAALTATRNLIAHASADELHDRFERARLARQRFLNLT